MDGLFFQAAATVGGAVVGFVAGCIICTAVTIFCLSIYSLAHVSIEGLRRAVMQHKIDRELAKITRISRED